MRFQKYALLSEMSAYWGLAVKDITQVTPQYDSLPYLEHVLLRTIPLTNLSGYGYIVSQSILSDPSNRIYNFQPAIRANLLESRSSLIVPRCGAWWLKVAQTLSRCILCAGLCWLASPTDRAGPYPALLCSALLCSVKPLTRLA